MASVSGRPPPSAEPADARPRSASSFDDQVAALEQARLELARELAQSTTTSTRGQTLARAQTRWFQALRGPLLTDWIGTPWGHGATANARTPRQPGRTVHCASFVIAVLRGVGLRFVDGDRLAQAPALRILEALAPEEGIVRVVGRLPQVLQRLGELGDGVYVLGLSRHIGFVIVDDETVTLVHASEGQGQVVAEPAKTSSALRGRSGALYLARLSSPARRHASGVRAGASDELDRGADHVLARWLAGAALGPR